MYEFIKALNKLTLETNKESYDSKEMNFIH